MIFPLGLNVSSVFQYSELKSEFQYNAVQLNISNFKTKQLVSFLLGGLLLVGIFSYVSEAFPYAMLTVGVNLMYIPITPLLIHAYTLTKRTWTLVISDSSTTLASISNQVSEPELIE